MRPSSLSNAMWSWCAAASVATAGLVPVLALMVGNLVSSAEAVKDGGLLSAGGRSSPAVLFIVIGTVCGLAMFLQVSTFYIYYQPTV